RQIKIRTTRLIYTFYAAQFIQDLKSDDLTDKVLDHLTDSQESMTRAWGKVILEALGTSPLGMLKKSTRTRLKERLGEQVYEQNKSKPLSELPEKYNELLGEELARQEVTEVYRRLILGVISELWIEYLTKVEALRVSIGLEAYGQRDPLVQYKNRASEMFQELFNEMRMSVVSRMFTFRLNSARAQSQNDAPVVPEISDQAAAPSQTGGTPASPDGEKKKRRRRKKK
ncbi:MAG: hypothetical protein OEY93_07115, partial [Anaerolineae bacterium]|nr:hypothetical protein [Anaerolineae bacterium]